MKSCSPKIFDYDDLSPFLRDYIAFRKKGRSSFSLQEFSNRAGFRSRAMLSMVLSGSRNLSTDSALRIADALKLKFKERDYLVLLAEKSRTKDASKKLELTTRLLQIRLQEKDEPIKRFQYRFLSHWYYSVIYLLIGEHCSSQRLSSFPQLIGDNLSKETIQQAVHEMLEIGLIKRNADGAYAQTQTNLVTENEIQEPAMYEFHTKMLEQAKKALALPSAEREFRAVTLDISEDEFEWVKERIREFRKDIVHHVDQKKSSGRIYQINIQAFPLTKNSKKVSRTLAPVTKETHI